MSTDSFRDTLPLDRRRDLEEVERIARWMDTAFRIPGSDYRIGLDGIVGLIPGIGDAATLIPAGYILYKAKAMNVPNRVFLQMLFNTGTDALLGSVPVIGDIFDIAFKSNKKNVELLRQHLQRTSMKDVTPKR